MFRVVSPPIIRSTNNCIYSIWYWSAVAGTVAIVWELRLPDAVDNSYLFS